MNSNYIHLSDFSTDTYRKNPDLKDFSKEDLINHYLNHGIEEGRVYNFIENRKSFLDVIEKSGNLLEIGPLDNPQLDAKSPYYYSVDVFTKAELVKFYKDDPNITIDNIIEPSYIIVNNDYSTIDKKFKCIFSSHNIEHMPCMVTFLQNLQGLLAKDGKIYLIIPDKRYCFDHYKKESDIYDILQLYFEKNYRPRLSDVLKMRTLSTHNNSIEHWNNNYGENNYKSRLLEQYNNILTEYEQGKYIDSHVNYLTPQSFLTIMELLKDLKLIDLEVKKCITQ
jgi:hypothetical protein